MRIIELHSENFKRIKAITIRPSEDVVRITGLNGNGKTSALDSIWAALKGRIVAGPEPIRKGCEQATIRLELGTDKVDWTVERTFSRTKHGELTQDLTITAADGSVVRTKPQALLDSFLGSLSFDPLAFARADKKTQVETLKKFVPGFDFDANARARANAFAKRTDVNRDANRERAAVALILRPTGPKPAPIDVAAKIDELQRAGELNIKLDRARQQKKEHLATIEQLRDGAEAARARAVTLDEEADRLEAAARAAGPIPDPIDVTALRAEIAQAEQVRTAIGIYEQRERHEQAAEAHELKSAALSDLIETLDKARTAAIENAKLPVEGLSLGEDEIYYNGVRFADASHAEKLVISTSIAMAENPKLRIIRSYEGSTLDSHSLGVIAAMARSRNYQCWIESVDESGKCGFVIVDGELAAVNQ